MYKNIFKIAFNSNLFSKNIQYNYLHYNNNNNNNIFVYIIILTCSYYYVNKKINK